MATMDRNIEWLDDVSTDRIPITDARNRMVARALRYEGRAQGVIWVDDDMHVERGFFSRLAGQDYDLLSALSFTRHPPHQPAAWDFNGNRIRQYPSDAIISVRGFGFGCVYTSLKLLRAVGDAPFGDQSRGEDYDFCQRAILAGFGAYIDTGVRCGHYGDPILITEETFLMHNMPNSVDPEPPPEMFK